MASPRHTTESHDGRSSPAAATGVLFVLQPHFSLLGFSGAADALVTANLISERTLYRVTSYTSTGSPVVSDIGVAVATTFAASHNADGANEVAGFDAILDNVAMLFVCGGYRCSLDEDPALTRLLRHAAGNGLALGGLWNGVAALAHAGLLDSYDCALHPRDRDGLACRFPSLRIRRRAVVVDRERLSAAGPASTLELMLALIARREGVVTAQAVREILTADARGDGDAAFAEDNERSLPAPLATALALMRNNLDEPLSRADLARHAGLSARSLERLFRDRLGSSPARHYLDLRLHRAAELLRSDKRPINDVARACGFADSAPFSRAFVRHFGQTPRAWRQSSTLR